MRQDERIFCRSAGWVRVWEGKGSSRWLGGMLRRCWCAWSVRARAPIPPTTRRSSARPQLPPPALIHPLPGTSSTSPPPTTTTRTLIANHNATRLSRCTAQLERYHSTNIARSAADAMTRPKKERKGKDNATITIPLVSISSSGVVRVAVERAAQHWCCDWMLTEMSQESYMSTRDHVSPSLLLLAFSAARCDVFPTVAKLLSPSFQCARVATLFAMTTTTCSINGATTTHSSRRTARAGSRHLRTSQC